MLPSARIAASMKRFSSIRSSPIARPMCSCGIGSSLACRLLVQRSRTLQVSALRVQDRDGGLDQSLVEELHVTVRALPDFFPRFVTFEEPSLVEEVDSLFVGMLDADASHDLVFGRDYERERQREEFRLVETDRAILVGVAGIAHRVEVVEPHLRDAVVAGDTPSAYADGRTWHCT